MSFDRTFSDTTMTDTEAPLSQGEEDVLYGMLPDMGSRGFSISQYIDEGHNVCNQSEIHYRSTHVLEIKNEVQSPIVTNSPLSPPVSPANAFGNNTQQVPAQDLLNEFHGNTQTHSNLIHVCEEHFKYPLISTDLASLPSKGKYLFQLVLEEESEPPKKSCSFTYSQKCKRLFIHTNTEFPLCFSTQISVPNACEIRIFLKYKNKRDEHTIVESCPYHRKDSTSSFVLECNEARYQVCPVTGHRVTSIKFPCNKKEVNENFKFICGSSCRGGINRRQITLVALLVVSGKVEGKVEQDVHISACPGRDRKNTEAKSATPKEEEHPMPQQIPTQLSSSSSDEDGKKTRLRGITVVRSKGDDDDRWYKINIPPIRGKRNAKCFAHLASLVSGISNINPVTVEHLSDPKASNGNHSSHSASRPVNDNDKKFRLLQKRHNVESTTLNRSCSDQTGYKTMHKRITLALTSYLDEIPEVDEVKTETEEVRSKRKRR